MDKKCPGCFSIFECRVDQIELCNCAKLNLTKGTREYIKDTYESCLCFDCLKKINGELSLIPSNETSK